MQLPPRRRSSVLGDFAAKRAWPRRAGEQRHPGDENLPQSRSGVRGTNTGTSTASTATADTDTTTRRRDDEPPRSQLRQYKANKDPISSRDDRILVFYFDIPLWLVRQRHRRILVEEVHWPNQEVMPHCRHHGPVFGTNNVMETDCVPADDVCVLDGPIRLGPCW